MIIKNLVFGSAKNTVSQKFFVPSYFIFLSISASILMCCSYIIDERISSEGILLLSLSLLSLPRVYCNALRSDTGATNRFSKRDLPRFMVLLSSAVLCSSLACIRIYGLLAEGSPPLDRSAWTARVESVIQRRYLLDAVVGFRAQDSGGAPPAGDNDWHRGAVYITGGGTVRSGDIIRFTGKPIAVKMRGGAPASAGRTPLLKGIRYIFYLDAGSVTVLHAGSSFREKVRDRLAAQCDALFSRETSSMVKALYFGNQDYIDKRTTHDFKRAGVLHILSASGHDVGVVAGVTVFLLGLIRINRKIIMAAAALVILLYLYITDMPVSLLRSCIMFFMYASQRIFDREVNIFNALFLSAAAILMIFPHEIYSLGFQLSYGATLGILLFYNIYRKTLSWLPAIITDSLALTISAQMLVLPLLLIRVSELNLVCLLSNIIVVPLMSLLLLVSLAANAMPVDIAAAYAARAADIIYSLNGFIVRFISGLNGHFYVETAGPVLVAAFCLLAFPLVPRLRGMKIMSLSIPAAIAVAWFILGVHDAVKRDDITVMRHRQGTLLFVKSGAALSLIGEIPEKTQIDPVLHEIAFAACREVNLHISHPDYRNMAGYTYLLKQLPVRRCYLSERFKVRKNMRRFFDVLERDRVELIIHECAPGNISGETAVGRGLPEQVCGLYQRVLAGCSQAPMSGFPKKNGIRYLTLH